MEGPKTPETLKAQSPANEISEDISGLVDLSAGLAVEIPVAENGVAVSACSNEAETSNVELRNEEDEKGIDGSEREVLDGGAVAETGAEEDGGNGGGAEDDQSKGNAVELDGGSTAKNMEVSGDGIGISPSVDFSNIQPEEPELYKSTGTEEMSKEAGDEKQVIENGQEHNFSVCDVIWVKTKSQTWWPGKIYPSEAAESEESSRSDNLLVGYFGSSHMTWCSPSQLVPFAENFEQMSGKYKSRSFLGAVEKAVDEFGRCVKLEMTCSCIPEGNRPLEGNDGPRRKTGFLAKYSVDRYEPETFLARVKGLAQIVSLCGALELSILYNQLAAFQSSIGHQQLPLHQLLETHAADDNLVGRSARKSKARVTVKNDEEQVEGGTQSSPLETLSIGSDVLREKMEGKNGDPNKVLDGSMEGGKRSSRRKAIANGGIESRSVKRKRSDKFEDFESSKMDSSIKGEVINPLAYEGKVSGVGDFDDGSRGMSEKRSETRERKKSKYLSFPYINWGHFSSIASDSNPNNNLNAFPSQSHSQFSLFSLIFPPLDPQDSKMEVDDRFVELNTRTCVVLGGRGFLGRSLVLRLLKLAKWNVRIADSAESLELDPSEHDSLLSDALVAGRASYFHVDVRNKDQIVAALSGSSVVFYMDYEDSHSNDIYLSYMFIVQGAKNVINACRDCKVRRLIFNSSADVIFDGSRDIHNGEESLTYPWKFEDMLSDLKAQAEALILFANDIDGLLTCALRPSNVFGPEDTRLVPFVVNQAKSGLAKFIIGNGENLSDFTFVENVTHAHICAEEALDFRMVSVAGKAFFITNFKPMKFWEFISLILDGLGYRRPSVKLPFKMVWNVFLFMKWIHEKFGISRYNHSTWAHYIQLASCTRTFNCVAAHKQIGYSPVVSMEEGITLTIESFSHLRKELSLASFTEFTEESKADKLLGGGRVADILLWREEKKSFTCFLASSLLFYWFFIRGGTFISSAAQLLLSIIVVLYGYGFLPPNIYGFPVQKLSVTMFRQSDSVVRDSIMAIACLWNRGVHNATSLARGEDWNYFFKAVASLYLLKLFLSQSLTMLIGMGLVFAFTAFFVYEQYETEIDGFAKFLFISIMELKRQLASHLPPTLMSFLCCDKLSHQAREVAVTKR